MDCTKTKCHICGKELEEGNRIRVSWNEELLRMSGKVKCRSWCGMNRVVYMCRDCSDAVWERLFNHSGR